MARDDRKIVIPPLKPRGTPAPKTRIIPNPKKEESRRKGREKVDVEKEADGE